MTDRFRALHIALELLIAVGCSFVPSGARAQAQLFFVDGEPGNRQAYYSQTLTAIPSFIAVWLRLRTGSVLLPVLLHNLGNSMSFINGKPG